MAGDWIKIEKVTARKPEVLLIAAELGVHPDQAFGLCFRFWSWCDDNLVDGHARTVTKMSVDALLDRAGFADALIKAGWLQVREGALQVPNFDRHLSQGSKNRALAAIRKAASRCHDPSVTKTGPEKRREEKSTIPPEDTPPPPAAPKRAPTETGDEWLAELEKMDCYKPLSIRAELGKANAWCSVNHRKCTKRFFTNWLLRALEDKRTVTTGTLHTEKSKYGF